MNLPAYGMQVFQDLSGPGLLRLALRDGQRHLMGAKETFMKFLWPRSEMLQFLDIQALIFYADINQIGGVLENGQQRGYRGRKTLGVRRSQSCQRR